MNEEEARPTVGRMTSPTSSCYYSSCDSPPKWGVASSVKQKNPDGSDLTLYTCNDHYNNLTSNMTKAGTRYTLFPVGGPHMVLPTTPEEKLDDFIKYRSFLYKAFIYTTIIMVGIVVGPFLVVYYGGQLVLGRLGLLKTRL